MRRERSGEAGRSGSEAARGHGPGARSASRRPALQGRRARTGLLALAIALVAAACARDDRPLVLLAPSFGASSDARVSIFLSSSLVDGSLAVTLDGVDVSAAFTRTAWGALGTLPVSGAGAHVLDARARFALGGGETPYGEQVAFSLPDRTPALRSSAPLQGASNVPRTAWLRLEFQSAVDPAALGGFQLLCRDASVEVERPVQVTAVTPSVVVVNPTGQLPVDGACALSWHGPLGMEWLAFRTAAAGAPATVLYDRTNTGSPAPFPDDVWTRADATSATGLRLDMPVPARTQDVVDVFASLLPQTRALDGWSPLAPIVIELSDAADPSTVPLTPAASLDPLATIVLLDLDPASPTHGQRIPFRTDVRNDLTSQNRRSRTLLLFPSIPLEPGGRYGLVVTNRALVSASRPLEASSFFAAALGPATPGEAPAIGAVRGLAGEVVDVAETQLVPPIPREDVSLALRISVRTTGTIPNDLVAIRADVRANPPPAVTITSITPGSATSPVVATVRGTFAAPGYRSNGIHLQRDAAGLPARVRTQSLDFTLAIPRASLTASAPVVMYQHGNPGSQNEVSSEARDYLAAAGFAVMGFTDVLNREIAPPSVGDTTARITQQVVNIVFNLLAYDRLPDYWVQTHAEQIAFLRVLETITSSPALRDLVPVGAPDGIVDLDASARRGYVGISEGANNGPGFLPYAPEISAAALVVGGARLGEVLIHQQATAFLQTLPALFPNVTPADIWVALSLFQTNFDVQDNHNHARFLYREPVDLGGPTQRASVLVTEGLGDSLVPNHATESLAWALGPIPHLEPVQRAVPFLQTTSQTIAGNVDAATTAGFFQFVPDGVIGIPATPGCLALSLTSRFEGHYCAQDAAEARAQRLHFLQSNLAGVPEIVNPFAP